MKCLLDYYGENAKGVIWAHNTHIGDARYTDMIQSGSLNIGQLLREEFGRDNIFIIGFGTFHGKVIAGKRWGADEEVMRIPHADKDSIEYALSLTDKDNSS